MSAGDVGQFTVLTNQPDHAKALVLLRTIHSLVKPLMVAHHWHLPKLSEFFPKNPGLLGMNRNGGAQIYIRLRPSSDHHSFYSLEDSQCALVGTMLHELTHNHRGPHDEQFYSFLDKLTDEYEKIRSSGWSGEGFLSVTGDGNKLGGGGASNLANARDRRERAARQAEQRGKLSKLMGIGGRLGGEDRSKGKTRAATMADAAERRARDAKRCTGVHLTAQVMADIEEADRDSRAVGGGSRSRSAVDRKRKASGKGSGSRVFIEISDDDDDGIRIGEEGDDDDDDVVIVEPPRKVLESGEKQRWKGKQKAAMEDEGVSASAKRLRQSAAASTPTPHSHKSTNRPILETTTTSAAASTFKHSSSSAPSRTNTSSHWVCSICTYSNNAILALACPICQSERLYLNADQNSIEAKYLT